MVTPRLLSWKRPTQVAHLRCDDWRFHIQIATQATVLESKLRVAKEGGHTYVFTIPAKNPGSPVGSSYDLKYPALSGEGDYKVTLIIITPYGAGESETIQAQGVCTPWKALIPFSAR